MERPARCVRAGVPVLLWWLAAAAPLPAQTVCTVTINSSDEAGALRRAFPRARIVELTSYGAGSASSTDWLSGACAARVPCDVLLISGHYAGKFFGESPFELPLRALERQACQRTCDGVLSRPRLVFLFGCNTLAGKHLDGRTPERYREVLLEDGLDPVFADRVVSLRYSPLGDDTRARMRRVFDKDALVFGFSSVGPTGPAAGPAFGRFLRDSRSTIDAAIAGRAAGTAGLRALGRSWTRAFSGLNPHVVGGGEPFSEDQCVLTDPREARLDRLRRAARLLDEDPLRHALLVWDFLQEQSGWQPEDTALLRQMQANPDARRSLMTSLPHLAESLDTYFSVLQFVRFLEWVDDDTVARLQAARLRAVLRDGVTVSERDFLCSSGLSYVPSDDLLARNRGNLRFIEALPCLSARSGSVREFLLAQTAHPSPGVQLGALEALAELSLLGPADTPRLRRLMNSSSGPVRASTLWALAASDGANPDVQRVIAAAADSADVDLAWTSSQVLEHLRVTDAVAQRSLARALRRPEGFVRRAAALALASIAPRDPGVVQLIREHRADADDLVRTAVHSIVSGADGALAAAESSPGDLGAEGDPRGPR